MQKTLIRVLREKFKTMANKKSDIDIKISNSDYLIMAEPKLGN